MLRRIVMFRTGTQAGGGGFKRFRPLRYDSTGALYADDNVTLSDHPTAPFNRHIDDGSARDFYTRLDRLINPFPVPAQHLLDARLGHVLRLLDQRVDAVADAPRRGTIAMPYGPAIFITTGDWEDLSTPARDFRLLLAIDALLQTPADVTGTEYFYHTETIPAALEAALDTHTLTYHRSDGSPWTLSLREIIKRRDALELAYNPNDCPEVRWAAPAESEEISTCRRRAPARQRARMLTYRHWFQARQRPLPP